MRTTISGVALLFTLVSGCAAADLGPAPRYSPAPGIEQFTYSWVALPPLPRRLQNHCGYVRGHFVCSDHCGIDYQVYYCSRADTGCCHIGHGYCDDGGRLRCTPTLF